MSAASERRTYVLTMARSSLRSGSWFAYSPLGRPFTRAERWRARWHRTMLRRVLELPHVLRAADRAYRGELGD